MGSGVTSPFTVSEPDSLMRVSRFTFIGRVKSRLSPSMASESGASATFAAGCMLRSSAEMRASRTSSRCRSNRQGGPAADEGAPAPAASWGPAWTASAGAACALAAGPVGGAASFIRLIVPPGSRHASTLTPDMATESTSAWRCARFSATPATFNAGMSTQSASESRGLTARSVSDRFATSSVRSTASPSANLYVAATSMLPESITKLSRSARYSQIVCARSPLMASSPSDSIGSIDKCPCHSIRSPSLDEPVKVKSPPATPLVKSRSSKSIGARRAENSDGRL